MSWGRRCRLPGPWEGSRGPTGEQWDRWCFAPSPGGEAEIEAAGAQSMTQGQQAIALALLWRSGAWAQGPGSQEKRPLRMGSSRVRPPCSLICVPFQAVVRAQSLVKKCLQGWKGECGLRMASLPGGARGQGAGDSSRQGPTPTSPHGPTQGGCSVAPQDSSAQGQDPLREEGEVGDQPHVLSSPSSPGPELAQGQGQRLSLRPSCWGDWSEMRVLAARRLRMGPACRRACGSA